MAKEWGSLDKRNGSWTVRYTDPGTRRRVRKTIGPCDGAGALTTREAREEVAVLRAALLQGHPGTSRMTLRAFLEFWLPLYCKRTSDTYAAACDHALREAAEHFDRLPMASVRGPHAEGYVVCLAAKFQGSTVHTHLSYLCVCWNAAIEREVVASNPWTHARKYAPKVELRVVTMLSPQQREKLIEAVPERCRAAIALIDQMGMRRAEASSLAWRDYSRPFLTIRKTKTKKARSLRLPEEAIAILESVRPDEPAAADSIFGVTPRILSGAFATAVRRTGLDVRGMHDLRHNVATRAAMGGATPYEIAKLLGNTPAICERYMDHAPNVGADRAVSALERISEHPPDSRATPGRTQIPEPDDSGP